MTYSNKEVVIIILVLSGAAFLITSVIIGDVPWLFIVNWVLMALWGIIWLVHSHWSKKNSRGDYGTYAKVRPSGVHPVTMSIDGSFTSHD